MQQESDANFTSVRNGNGASGYEPLTPLQEL